MLPNGQGDVDALARRLLDPAEPPLPGHGANALVGIAITMVLLAWGPLTLSSSIRRAGQATRQASGAATLPKAIPDAHAPVPPPQSVPATIDRFDVLRSPLTPAIALVLASRLGAWQEVPFAAWWGALAVVVIAFAILVRQARALTWCRKGVRRAIGHGLMTALEVTVLALMFT